MSKGKRNEIIFAFTITIIMTIMDISGLPAALFINIKILDIQPFYFSLTINFILTAIVFFVGWKTLYSKWDFGLGTKGLLLGIKKYGLSGLIIFLFSTLAFVVGLMPFDNKPTVPKVVIEGFIYYIGVAFIEELYIRGLLLNIIEKLLYKKQNATLYAILTSSVIFGVGHIFGTLGSSLLTIVCKVLWTVGLGLYLGVVYKKTNNLWVSIILHAVIDFCAFPFCFSSIPPYPKISLWILLFVYVLVCCYSFYIFRKSSNLSELTEHTIANEIEAESRRI